MIEIDMPMPARCMDCPCSYWIQTGEHEGKLMCNVMEYREICSGLREPPTTWFLVTEEKRHENCPMTECLK